MALVLGVAAATARPLSTAALPPVPPVPELPAAQHGTMLALSAQPSIACWLTSVGVGLLPYDMLPATMLNLTLSAAACCQPAASTASEELQLPAETQIE